MSPPDTHHDTDHEADVRDQRDRELSEAVSQLCFDVYARNDGRYVTQDRGGRKEAVADSAPAAVARLAQYWASQADRD